MILIKHLKKVQEVNKDMGLKPENIRRERLQELINLVYSAELFDYTSLVGLYVIRTGLTSKTVMSMLKDIKDAGLITIDNGIVKKLEKPAQRTELA